jgi:ssDNA-binding Zn-finger/Zn-ribbon topoisomerase 1
LYPPSREAIDLTNKSPGVLRVVENTRARAGGRCSATPNCRFVRGDHRQGAVTKPEEMPGCRVGASKAADNNNEQSDTTIEKRKSGLASLQPLR